MKIALIIATTGRPEILTETLIRLTRQVRQPDTILVVCADDKDFTERHRFEHIQVALGRKGSSTQRNHGIDMVGATHDIMVFLDDDFVPLHRRVRAFDDG